MVCHRMGGNQPSQNQFSNFQDSRPYFPDFQNSKKLPDFQNFQKVRPYVLENSCPLGLGSLEILEFWEIFEISEVLETSVFFRKFWNFWNSWNLFSGGLIVTHPMTDDALRLT